MYNTPKNHPDKKTFIPTDYIRRMEEDILRRNVMENELKVLKALYLSWGTEQNNNFEKLLNQSEKDLDDFLKLLRTLDSHKDINSQLSKEIKKALSSFGIDSLEVDIHSKYKSLLAAGDDFFQKGKFEEALEEYEKAKAIHDIDEINNKIGTCTLELTKKNITSKIKSTFDFTTEKDPTNPEYTNLLTQGDLLFNAGKLRRALDKYLDAQKLNDTENIREKISECTALLDESALSADAVEKYSKLVEEAENLIKDGKLAEALKKLEEAQEIDQNLDIDHRIKTIKEEIAKKSVPSPAPLGDIPDPKAKGTPGFSFSTIPDAKDPKDTFAKIIDGILKESSPDPKKTPPTPPTDPLKETTFVDEETRRRLIEEEKDIKRIKDILGDKATLSPDVRDHYESELKKKQDAQEKSDPKSTPEHLNTINVVFVSIEEKLQKVAERLAQERLDREMKEMRGVTGFLKKWWTRNAAEGYLAKYAEEYKKRLKEDPKYRAELMGLKRDRVRPVSAPRSKIPLKGPEDFELTHELDAIAARFGIAWNEKKIGNTAAGKELLTKNESLTGKNYHGVQKDLLAISQQFIAGTLNEDQFKAEFNKKILPKVERAEDQAIVAFLENKNNVSDDPTQRGLLDRLKVLKSHVTRMNAVDKANFISALKIDIALGKAQHVDARTDERSTGWADRFSRKIVSKVQKLPFLGSFITPGTVGVGVYGLTNILTNYGVGSLSKMGLAGSGLAFALAPVVGPAVMPLAATLFTGAITGGILAGMRENKEISRLKKQKEKRDALNFSPENDDIDPKAERFERTLESKDTLYNKENAEDLINEFQRVLAPGASQDELWKHYVHVHALRDLSEFGIDGSGTGRLDLIRFTNETKVEQERLKLFSLLKEAGHKLRFRIHDGKPFHKDFTIERDRLIGEINQKDRKFKTLKRNEVLKASVVGAAWGLGGSLVGGALVDSIASIHHWWSPNSYTYNHDGLVSWLGKNGFSDEQISQHVVFSDGKLTTESMQYLSQHGVQLSEIAPLAGFGTPGDAMTIQNTFTTHGLDANQFQVDENGHIKASTINYLKEHGLKITEHAGAITSTYNTQGVDITSKGFGLIEQIHFNQNIPGRHVLDELRFHWDGAPGVGFDGNVHFKIDRMLDPKLIHSNLPKGVHLPGGFESMKFGLQVDQGGHHYWKFFSPDASGHLSIPAEFFDSNNLAYVPAGGNALPGLKTTALAVGFDDQHGTYQVLASLGGQNAYTPEISVPIPNTAEVTYTLDPIDPVKYKVPTRWYITPPTVGNKMKHLEYGEHEEVKESSVKFSPKSTHDVKKEFEEGLKKDTPAPDAKTEEMIKKISKKIEEEIKKGPGILFEKKEVKYEDMSKKSHTISVSSRSIEDIQSIFKKVAEELNEGTPLGDAINTKLWEASKEFIYGEILKEARSHAAELSKINAKIPPLNTKDILQSKELIKTWGELLYLEEQAKKSPKILRDLFGLPRTASSDDIKNRIKIEKQAAEAFDAKNSSEIFQKHIALQFFNEIGKESTTDEHTIKVAEKIKERERTDPYFIFAKPKDVEYTDAIGVKHSIQVSPTSPDDIRSTFKKVVEELYGKGSVGDEIEKRLWEKSQGFIDKEIQKRVEAHVEALSNMTAQLPPLNVKTILESKEPIKIWGELAYAAKLLSKGDKSTLTSLLGLSAGASHKDIGEKIKNLESERDKTSSTTKREMSNKARLSALIGVLKAKNDTLSSA